MKTLQLIAPALVAAFGVSLASAQVIMLDFGGTATDRATNSPYHTASGGAFTDSTWNTIGLTDPTSIVSSTGAATGVSVNMGLNSTTGTTINLNTQPTTLLAGTAYGTGSNIYTGTSVGRDGIFGTTTTNPWVGVQISGLNAGTYDVYVAARNTNTGTGQANYSQNVYVSKSALGDFNFSGYNFGTLSYDGSDPLNASASWVVDGNTGENYLKLSVSITAGQAINLAVTGGGTGAAARGFLNAVQIVPTSQVPEPSSFAALAGLGAIGFVATRRRRAAR